VTIVSSDKDFHQLVGEDVSCFDPFNMVRLGPDEIFEKYGVSLSEVIIHQLTNNIIIIIIIIIIITTSEQVGPTGGHSIIIHHFPLTWSKRRLQLEPDQLLDYFGLIGDASDNVPGVPGIGPKTAQELLEEFETFDDMWEFKEEIESPRLRKIIEENLEKVSHTRNELV
jgi:5'-3' exonuclease